MKMNHPIIHIILCKDDSLNAPGKVQQGEYRVPRLSGDHSQLPRLAPSATGAGGKTHPREAAAGGETHPAVQWENRSLASLSDSRASQLKPTVANAWRATETWAGWEVGPRAAGLRVGCWGLDMVPFAAPAENCAHRGDKAARASPAGSSLMHFDFISASHKASVRTGVSLVPSGVSTSLSFSIMLLSSWQTLIQRLCSSLWYKYAKWWSRVQARALK